MTKIGIFSISFLVVLLLTSQAWGKGSNKATQEPWELCANRLTFVGPKIKFGKLETTLLCGDPQTPAWDYIPLNQVKFHLTGFLQQRGYLNPIYQESQGPIKNYLTVTLGKKTKVTQVSFISPIPQFLKIKRRWKTIGSILTPQFLTELEKWIQREFQTRGYPCPKVKSIGNIETGEVQIEIDSGAYQNTLAITQEEVPGIESGVLRRYDAFKMNQPFDESLLELTSLRIERSGLLQNTYFRWDCTAEGAEIYQQTVAGKPRLIRLGVGADTEQFLILRGFWQHTRLGKNASNLSAELFASFKQQKFSLLSEWYAFDAFSSFYFRPELQINHEIESDFRFLSADLFFPIAYRYDSNHWGLVAALGPNLNFTQTFKGADEGLTRFLSLQMDWDLMSHDYEIYQLDPRSGYRVEAKVNLAHQSLLSDLTVQRFQLDGHYYFNFKKLDPPLFVFGIRGGIYTTWFSGSRAEEDQLPPNYRFYLGGAANLRGFDRQELPAGNRGALSAAFVSAEFRLANYLPWGVEPFVFFDAGLLGGSALDFNAPLYYSPGFGLRLDTPIGVFRTTFAHGFKTGSDGESGNTHFQFFISFGEEF